MLVLRRVLVASASVGLTGLAPWTGPTGCGHGSASGANEQGGPAVGASVLEFHDHLNRDGFYVDPAITKASVATLHRDTSFDGTIQGNVYGQPLYVENGPGGKGAFYVATESDDVYALDETTGGVVWHVSVGTPAKQTGAGCGNVSPIGVTGTPAIDPASRTIVFDAATADAGGSIATHTIHALSIDDGSERWRVDASTLKDPMGRSFSPQPENQRSAVLVVGGVAYVAYGGHSGDCGDYHGWLVGVPIANPAGVRTYATPARAAGMWAPGGPASDGTSIFAVTGNRTDDTSTWGGSEGVLRFEAGPTFSEQPNDYFVPDDWSTTLDPDDLDLGGSGPLVVDAPALEPSALVVAQGKDGKVYLLDRSNLGGIGTANVGSDTMVSGEFIQSGAFATVRGTTYLVLHGHRGAQGTQCPGGTSGDLLAIALDPGAPHKMKTAWCANSHRQGSPIITTSDGAHDALVWTAGAESDGALHAWDLATGAVVFGGGATQVPALRRFTTLIDVKGRLVVAADGRVYAFEP